MAGKILFFTISNESVRALLQTGLPPVLPVLPSYEQINVNAWPDYKMSSEGTLKKKMAAS